MRMMRSYARAWGFIPTLLHTFNPTREQMLSVPDRLATQIPGPQVCPHHAKRFAEDDQRY